jgi:Ser/Thr protein kinase RdoA (MazF antagonist)
MTARKEGLERSQPVIPLVSEEAARLLRPVVGDVRITRVALLHGGLGNSNYLVSSTGSPDLVIRIHARGVDSRDVELNLLRLLSGRVSVPRVLHAGDDAVTGDQPYLILEYCRGKTLNDWIPQIAAADVEALGSAVGAELARIAEVTFDRPGLLSPELKIKAPIFEGTNPYFDFMANALFKGNAGRALGERLRDRMWRFVSEHHAAIDLLDAERTLVHADFDGSNVLIEQRGQDFVVSGVIDWEYALSGPRVMDLSSILRYPENLPAGFESALVAGFTAEGGTLQEDWLILARFVDMLAYCAFLNKDSAPTRRRIYETALRAAHEKLLALGY